MSVSLVNLQASQWGDGTMGHTYLKAVYREFTDGSFTAMKNQTNPTDGLLGPTLHAEVGDMITIVFQVCPLSLIVLGYLTEGSHHCYLKMSENLKVRKS